MSNITTITKSTCCTRTSTAITMGGVIPCTTCMTSSRSWQSIRMLPRPNIWPLAPSREAEEDEEERGTSPHAQQLRLLLFVVVAQYYPSLSTTALLQPRSPNVPPVQRPGGQPAAPRRDVPGGPPRSVAGWSMNDLSREDLSRVRNYVCNPPLGKKICFIKRGSYLAGRGSLAARGAVAGSFPASIPDEGLCCLKRAF